MPGPLPLFLASPLIFTPHHTLNHHIKSLRSPPVTLSLRNRLSDSLPYRLTLSSNPNPSVNGFPLVPPPSPRKTTTPLEILFTTFPPALILIAVPFLWASYSICIKVLYRLPWSISAALFNFLRLFLACLFALPQIISSLRNSPSNLSRKAYASVFTAGAELGLYTFIVNILQAYGLQFTTASRGSFLGQLATVIVPIAAFATGLEPRLGLNVIAAAFMAISGVALLTLDNVAASFSWRGDGTFLFGAFIGAAYILRSKMHSKKSRLGPLIPMKVVSQALFAMIFLGVTSGVFANGFPTNFGAVFAGATPMLLAINVGIVVWAGVFISIVSTWLQIYGQGFVSASRAVVIFSLTPLWSSLLAVPLGERFGAKGFLGAALVLASTLLASLKGIGPGSKKEKR